MKAHLKNLNAPELLSAGASSRTPLGELTALPSKPADQVPISVPSTARLLSSSVTLCPRLTAVSHKGATESAVLDNDRRCRHAES